MIARTETAAHYLSHDDSLIASALAVLESRLRTPGQALTSPSDSENFLRLKMAGYDHEVFAVLFLDCQNCVIEFREMFRGTLTQTSVYPREIVKVALELNAGAVILAHNHPSGNPSPSRADELLTKTLKSTLDLVGVSVLDHIVVGHRKCTSFATLGLI